MRIASIAATVLLAAALPVAGQVMEISGSTTVHKRVVEPNVAAIKAATGVELRMFPVGSGKGLIDLAGGKVKVAAVSESLDEAVSSAAKGAKAEGKEFKRPADLQFHALVEDKVVAIVHRDNPVTKLTREQVRDLSTGKIRNWKEVGGADLAVRVVTGAPNSATRAVFQSRVMDGQEYASDAMQMRATVEEVRAVGVNPGAIGAVAEGMAKSAEKVKALLGISAQRPLAFVTIGEPSPDARKVIAFLRSKDGQKLLGP